MGNICRVHMGGRGFKTRPTIAAIAFLMEMNAVPALGQPFDINPHHHPMGALGKGDLPHHLALCVIKGRAGSGIFGKITKQRLLFGTTGT